MIKNGFRRRLSFIYDKILPEFILENGCSIVNLNVL